MAGQIDELSGVVAVNELIAMYLLSMKVGETRSIRYGELTKTSNDAFEVKWILKMTPPPSRSLSNVFST